MKRDFSWLGDEDIEGIKKWMLDSDVCPFAQHCDITCEKIFPMIPFSVTLGYLCPCDAYGIKYVRRVANKILEYWEKR